MPDALKKAKNQDEVEEILGENVTEESFEQLDDCSTVTANARCYAIVSKQNFELYSKFDSNDFSFKEQRASNWIPATET